MKLPRSTRTPAGGKAPFESQPAPPGGRNIPTTVAPIAAPAVGRLPVAQVESPVGRPPVTASDSESPAADAVADAYRSLIGTASILNAVSDELGKSIGVLDAALKKLNLGIPVWVRIDKNNDEHDGDFNHHYLGYAKVDGRWGVALATSEGNYGSLPHADEDDWLFNDAPRALRVEAVEHLPTLLTEMTKKASEVAESIRTQSEMARDIANAIDIASKTSVFTSR
jgi:hypothetical protein